jgi:menaquinone-dependent protoporphyrinogen oxidase
MARVLVVYGSTEGQTAKIAQHIGDAGRRLGHEVDVQAAGEGSDAEAGGYDGIIVGASLHEGRYQRSVCSFLERHGAALASLPTAFFSVSLAAASHDRNERAEVERIMAEFCARARWTPTLTASFAGALKFTRYSWLKRTLMKHIAEKEGGDVDTSRDFEYTDFDQVTAFAERFFKALA